MKWFVWVWTALVVIIPALIGLGLILNPGGMPGGAEITLADVAAMAGVRNIVLSLLVAYAAFRMPKGAVALLIVGRGLTDLVDGLMAMASGGVGQASVMPVVMGGISLVAAYLITKLAGDRIFGAGTAQSTAQ
jgi:hypothetical protein